MPNPKPLAPPIQKKLLPDGIPPPQPPEKSPAPGGRQVLRVNQACKACRRAKMRCEGPGTPPCIRCKASGSECVFEKVGRGEVEPVGKRDRMRELEIQMESIRSTQLDMQNTLHEILSQLRDRPTRSVSHASGNSFGCNSAVASPEEYRSPRHSGDSLASSRMSSSAVLPPLQTIVGTDSLPIFTGSRPSSRSSSTTLHSYPTSSHLPPVRSSHYTSDPSSALSPLSLLAGSHPSPSPSASGSFEVPQLGSRILHDNGRLLSPESFQNPSPESSSLRRPVNPEPVPEGGLHLPSKKRRRNDIRSLLHEDGRNSWAPSVPVEESVTDVKIPDVIEKGLISESDARTLWQMHFDGLQLHVPIFNPTTDTFDSLRGRSPLCFCSILMLAARIRDGPEEPSHLQQALYNEATEYAKDSVFKGVDRIEMVQAMLFIAAWSRPSGGAGWLTAGHTVRLAVELGLHRSIPGLAAKLKEGKTVDVEADQVLVTAARVWLAIYGFEYQICLGTGRPPMTGGQNTVRGARAVLLHHPLALPSDIRLVLLCELYSLIEKYVDLMPIPEDTTPSPSPQFLEKLKEATASFLAWQEEWLDIMSQLGPLPESLRASIRGFRAFADFHVNGRLLHNLRTTADLENMSPELKDVAFHATLAAKEAIEGLVNNADYRDSMRYAVPHGHTSYGFTGVFLFRMCRVFPETFEIPQVVAQLHQLLEVLSRNPAGIFYHRLKALLSSVTEPLVPSIVATPTWNVSAYPPAPFAASADANATRESDQHLHPSSYCHGTGAFSPHRVALHQTPASALWAASDQQAAGDAPTTVEYINTQFAGDL